MPAGNRSPLGFATILAFHLCVLASGVLLQNTYDRFGSGPFLFVCGVGLAGLVASVIAFRRFLWDLFRSFKSAGVLLTLLVLSCVGGTMIIQDLDLRRAGVFREHVEMRPGDRVPAFDPNTQVTRFAVAESHFLLWAWSNEERDRLTEQKVKLSESEEERAKLRAVAFGADNARTFRKAMLGSKRRSVEDLTTSNYAKRHHGFFYRAWLFCRAVHIFDIFEAWWFYMLLGLIGVNVIVGTFARAPWTVRDMGVAITHAGIITILVGAFLDRLVAKEGYIYFTYGKPQLQVAEKIFDQKDRVHYRLPFRVHLDRFATEHYHELFVQRLDWSRRHDGSPWPHAGNGHAPSGAPFRVGQTFPVRAGVPHVFEGKKKVRVTVHAYKPRVFVQTVVEDRGDGGPLNPAVKLGLYNNPRGGHNFFVQGNSEPWLFAHDERRVLDFDRSRFEYAFAGSEGEYRDLLREAPVPDNGTLVLRAGSETKRVPVRLGASRSVRIGGQDVAIDFVRIESAFADSENVNLDRRLQRSEEPLLRLHVNRDPVGVYRDDTEFTSRFDLLEGVEFRFDWPNPRDSGVHAIYRVVEAPGQPRVLVQATPDGAVRTDELRRGQPVELLGDWGGATAFLGFEGHARSALERREIREVTDEEFLKEGGGAADHLLAAWADVEIEGPWGKVRRELTPYDRPILYGPRDQPPLLAFSLVKTQQARDWFSVLTVADRDGNPVESHPVQVNSPLRHGGYRFFQATAATDRDGLGVSGISVTKNPGVNFMYVGYTVLTLGVCYIFFFKPSLDRRRRRRRKEAMAS